MFKTEYLTQQQQRALRTQMDKHGFRWRNARFMSHTPRDLPKTFRLIVRGMEVTYCTDKVCPCNLSTCTAREFPMIPTTVLMHVMRRKPDGLED